MGFTKKGRKPKERKNDPGDAKLEEGDRDAQDMVSGS